MKRIRIGKDISMRWEITTDGVAIPLDGRDLTVEIKSPMGIENNIPYRVEGNILIMTYYGYEQKRTGEYSITLWEKKGKPGQNVVDVIRAFKLVETSQEEDDFVGGDLQIESVDLGTENFDILTEGGYRAINIDTLQAEALEDSVNINGKTYSNESFTITLPKANLDSAGVMGASDVRTLKEHADSIAQIKTSCEKNASDISVISDELGTLNSQVDANTADIASLNTEVSTLQSKVDENTTSISQINTELDNKNDEIAQINTTLEEHTESINAKITTDRIEDGAVTSEKIATTAFDSTLSVSGKIAPADVVGRKLTYLDAKINGDKQVLEGEAKESGTAYKTLVFHFEAGKEYHVKCVTTGASGSFAQAWTRETPGGSNLEKVTMNASGAVFVPTQNAEYLYIAFVYVATYDISIESNAGLVAELQNKVDKVEGKGLSANDFTDEYKRSVDKIPTLEEKNEELTSSVNMVKEQFAKGVTPDKIYKEKYSYEYQVIEPDEIKENNRIKGYTNTAPVGKIITGTSEINGVYLHIYTIGDKKKVQMTIPDYSVIGFAKSIFAFVGRRNDEDGYCMRYFTLAQIQENTYGCFEIKDGILTVDVDAWRQNGVGIISYFDVSATNQIYFVSTNDTDRLVVLEAKEFSYKLSDFKWLEQDGNIEEVVLPRKIIGATGIEMNLYKDNALLYTNIDSVCAVKFMDFPAGAFECKTRFRCKPTTTRDSNPQFSVFLSQFKNADIVKNVNLRIVDSSIVSGKSPNVLVIGDSKVNGGRLSSELRKDLTANGATPNFIGTIMADAFNIYHEGRAGWTSADYTKPTSKTNYTNAFWDGSKFNFTYYMTQNGFSGVDYVFINLGTNDYASSANLGKLDYINDFISNINTMISSIRQYDANVPIIIGLAEGVCTYQWSSSNDNYLYNLNTRARLLNKAAIAEWDNRESEKLFVCPLYLSMDMENDYVMIDVPLSDRDETHTTGKTRKSVTDTMHQSAVGYGKNADYMFAMIAYIESGM